MWNDRTKVLIGEIGVQKLEKARVAIIGVGGVGGAATTMLARAGIGNFTLVDFDVVDETNINRQFVANINTVGKLKTEVMASQIHEINPKCNVKIVSERLTVENLAKIFDESFDFVVDAIDSVQDKVELITYCVTNNIKIVSAMGSGNRVGIPNFIVTDIFKTFNDGLAKVMRKKLRERGISALPVATSTEQTIKHDEKVIGSISYYPAMCGCVISAYVIEKLLS
ncbi:MAG: ThiF family adenylyltransferase [Clostridia bacterium]|nr:ThiF family adenylyltransferase [Clostridia bacterium]